jgi:hypothetical protein
MQCLLPYHFYVIGSDEENVGNDESGGKRVRRPHRFWVHDVKHGMW